MGAQGSGVRRLAAILQMPFDIGDQLGRSNGKLLAVPTNALLMRCHSDQHARQARMRAGGLPDRPVFTGRDCRLGPLGPRAPDSSPEDGTWQDAGRLCPIITLLLTQQPIPLAELFKCLVIVCDCLLYTSPSPRDS